MQLRGQSGVLGKKFSPGLIRWDQHGSNIFFLKITKAWLIKSHSWCMPALQRFRPVSRTQSGDINKTFKFVLCVYRFNFMFFRSPPPPHRELRPRLRIKLKHTHTHTRHTLLPNQAEWSETMTTVGRKWVTQLTKVQLNLDMLKFIKKKKSFKNRRMKNIQIYKVENLYTMTSICNILLKHLKDGTLMSVLTVSKPQANIDEIRCVRVCSSSVHSAVKP